jgi:putative glutamine amidotransferase
MCLRGNMVCGKLTLRKCSEISGSWAVRDPDISPRRHPGAGLFPARLPRPTDNLVTMSLPIVGVSTASARASWGSWTDAPTTLLLETYANRLVEAGASPVLLFSGSDPDDIVGLFDGIVLVGGQDVDPEAYGALRDPSTQDADRRRDHFESALVVAASQRDLPLLAICRGLQVLNVTRGGTLLQHLPDVVGHQRHSPGRGIYGETKVEIEPDSTLARSLGTTTKVVDCYHHQGIDRLGGNLVVVGRAHDGVVEAVEDPSLQFMIGVQWHPEVHGDAALFGSFVDASAARRKR